MDIAGLVKGASAGEGLGNQFLHHIREVEAIVQVVRCFENPDVHHVSATIDPVRDIEVINTELVLADLASLQKRRDRIQKQLHAGFPRSRCGSSFSMIALSMIARFFAGVQLFLYSVASPLQRSNVRQHELGIDDLDVANWINRRAHVMNVRIFKTTHDLHDRFDFANVMEELIPEPFARARAFDQTGDIDKLDCRWRDFFRVGNLGDFFQSRIGHGYDADVRIDRAERIIFRRRFVRACDRIEKRRFPDVRQSYNSSTKHLATDEHGFNA